MTRAIDARRRHRREEGRCAAGAARARPARRLQGEPAALEDREEGTLGRPRADGRAAADRRARARDPRVHGRWSTGPSRRRSSTTARRSPPSCTRSTATSRRSTTEAAAQAIARRPRRTPDVRRHRRQAPRAPQESRRRRSPRARCSRRPPRSSASAPSARCAWRRTSTRASSSGRPRAPWASSRTCAPTRRASRRAPRWQAREFLGAAVTARSSSPTAPQLYGGGEATATRRTRTRRSGPPIPRAARTTCSRYLSPTSSGCTSSSGSASWRRRWRRRSSTRPRSTSTPGAARTCSAPPARVMKFQGFLVAVQGGARGRERARRSRTSRRFPPSSRASACRCARSRRAQHFTEPPPRFSEAAS